MKKTKILVLCHVPPDRVTFTTMLFQRISPILKKKKNIEIIWAVLMSKKIENVRVSENERILDIRNYKNFLEIINNEEPDLVYAAATFSFMDYAASTAAKHCKTPVLSRWYNSMGDKTGRQNDAIKSYPRRFFEDKTPTDEENDSKMMMKRGRFFLYKYWYLMKTLKATGINLPKRFVISLKLLNIYLNMGKRTVFPEFANTMHWLENESTYNELKNSGYKEESLIVTGNPIYDDAYNESKINQKKDSKKIRVLFAPVALFEHGVITKEQNEFSFKTILEKINSQQKFELITKIHPTTRSMENYSSLAIEVDGSIQLIDKGHILDYILKSDVLVTYPGNSTMIVNALIAKIPIIVCNFFNIEPGTYVKEHLVKQCTNPDELEKMIFEYKNYQNKNIDKFMIKHFFKNDGKSADRLCDVIIKMIS